MLGRCQAYFVYSEGEKSFKNDKFYARQWGIPNSKVIFTIKSDVGINRLEHQLGKFDVSSKENASTLKEPILSFSTFSPTFGDFGITIKLIFFS